MGFLARAAAMTRGREAVAPLFSACRCEGIIRNNRSVSRGLLQLDLEVSMGSGFQPGQFAMLNRTGSEAWTFGRPLSILRWQDSVVSFLYRVVGRGTKALSGMKPGTVVSFLGPLGRGFPADLEGQRAMLVAGGVGLPPLHAWWQRFSGAGDQAFLGARDGADVPWPLVAAPWRVTLEDSAGYEAERYSTGLVTGAVAAAMDQTPADESRTVLACGPWPLLRAISELAAQRGWPCWLSLEEHMGCGYGACKGCVVPVLKDPEAEGSSWRPATCCQEGPVFLASDLAWSELA